MDFSFTAEQKQITEMVADFVDEEVVPVADEVDADDEFRGTWSSNSPTST